MVCSQQQWWIKRCDHMECSTMRLWSILLSSQQRPKQLLQQRICTQSHGFFNRCPSNNINALGLHHIGIAVVNANANRRHCRLHRHAIRHNLRSRNERLHQRKAPNRCCRGYHWGYLRCRHCRPCGRPTVVVQDGETSAKTEGALRRAVLSDCSVPKNHSLNGVSHGKRVGRDEE